MTLIDTPTSTTSALADDLLLGAKAIADFLGFDLRETYYGLERGHIPATRRGRLYIGSKRRLTKHYTGQ
jgi:hypothetical protein